MNASLTVPMVAAVCMVVGIAEYFRRYARDVEGFYVAQRRAHFLLILGTYVASWVSVTGMVGMSGSAYRLGIAYNQLTWGFWGVLLSTFLICLPLRKLASRMQALRVSSGMEVGGSSLLTPTDFLELRFPSRAVRGVMAVMLVVGLMAYATGQIIGMTLAFQTLGMTYGSSLIISLAILAWTSSRGGTPGVIVNDTINMFTFVIIVLVFCPMAVAAVGGLKSLVALGEQVKPGIWSPTGHGTTLAMLLSYNLAWNSMTGGSPHLIQRVYAASDERAFAKATVVGIPIVIIWTWLLYTGAKAGVVLFPNLEGLASDRILIMVASQTMPSILAGLMLAGIFAAGLSTVNTQITNIAFSLGRDVYQVLFKPKASEQSILAVTKWAIWGVTCILGILTWIRPGFIYELTSWGVGFYGCVFVPVFIMGLHWKRATTQGVLWGSILTMAVFIVVTALKPGFHPILVGLPLAIVTMMAISLLTQQSSHEKQVVSQVSAIMQEYKPEKPASMSDYLPSVAVIIACITFGLIWSAYF